MTKQKKEKNKKEKTKKSDYHSYPTAKVTCSCGNAIKTGSTIKEMRVEICSACHPFYTGSQKVIDSGGRIEKFQKRLAKKDGLTAKKKRKNNKSTNL